MSKIITLKSLVTISLLLLLLILGSIKILSGNYAEKPKVTVSDINLITEEGAKTPYSGLFDKPKLVFFGFTSCPSICPATLSNITAALDIVGSDATKLHVMFITTDPQRDTPEVLKNYLQNFNSNIKGYTGDIADLKKMYKKYYVYAQDAPAGQAKYELNHSTAIYLVSKDGELVDHYASDIDPAELAKKLTLFFKD